jgi:hypothetical protein
VDALRPESVKIFELQRIASMKTAILAAAMLLALPAQAGVTYMTGGDPWGTTTNDTAMDMVFGAGNWTKVNGYDASVFNTSNFVFIEGGDWLSGAFGDFLNDHGSSFASFVQNGGRALVQAAPNDPRYNSYALPGGLTLNGIDNWSYPHISAVGNVTAEGKAAGLDRGAGTSFSGNWFAHTNVVGGTCLISGDNGCVTAFARSGLGQIAAGGETTSYWHQPQPGAMNLRANELRFAAGLSAGGVPEPSSWALLIAGFGLVGAAQRRRKLAAA